MIQRLPSIVTQAPPRGSNPFEQVARPPPLRKINLLFRPRVARHRRTRRWKVRRWSGSSRAQVGQQMLKQGFRLQFRRVGQHLLRPGPRRARGSDGSSRCAAFAIRPAFSGLRVFASGLPIHVRFHGADCHVFPLGALRESRRYCCCVIIWRGVKTQAAGTSPPPLAPPRQSKLPTAKVGNFNCRHWEK